MDLFRENIFSIWQIDSGDLKRLFFPAGIFLNSGTNGKKNYFNPTPNLYLMEHCRLSNQTSFKQLSR